MPFLIRLFQLQIFFLVIHCSQFQGLYNKHTCNYNPMAGITPPSNISAAMSKAPATITPLLTWLFHIYFLLHCIHCFCGYRYKPPVTNYSIVNQTVSHVFIFITPHPLFLQLYVQGSCIYYSTVSHINLFFGYTPSNVSLAIHPRHFQLY